MSVFKVSLNNTQQGQLDYNPATATAVLVGNDPQATQVGSQVGLGYQMNPSIQRTMFVAGPNRIYRELFDGQTFTDCNYWKQFAFPQVPLDHAFITVLTDDGSIWSDVPGENNFPATPFNTAGGGTTFIVNSTYAFTTTDSTINIVNTYGGYASFMELHNLSSNTVKYQLNGDSNAVMTLLGNTTVIYDTGDLLIGQVSFQGDGSHNNLVEVLFGIQSACNS